MKKGRPKASLAHKLSGGLDGCVAGGVPRWARSGISGSVALRATALSCRLDRLNDMTSQIISITMPTPLGDRKSWLYRGSGSENGCLSGGFSSSLILI
jgi:hypothetical protein